jgi:hypothetical protein
MSEPIWKLMSNQPMQDSQVVWRKWPDGRQESCLVTAEEYVKWLEEGNEPLPADEGVSN